LTATAAASALHTLSLVYAHPCSLLLPFLPIAVFFFTDTASTAIYTLSLHDALPICGARYRQARQRRGRCRAQGLRRRRHRRAGRDRKSTRLNSSHVKISYAVFCLKKKTQRANSGRVYADNDSDEVEDEVEPRDCRYD